MPVQKIVTILDISGYQILENLYQGRHSAVFRGFEQGRQHSVIIKVPWPTSQLSIGVSKLRAEFEIRQRINSDYVVKFIELKSDSTYGCILIEEDDQADTLSDRIPANGFEPLEFLNLAIQLTKGLQDIHQSHVIHKDIKPANIIFRRDTGKVKFIDFSSASLLRHYQQTAAVASTEGTISYISPEQTGRINRMIDYRTDFYSLGVTFYQMLCGRLPFVTKNLAELVHCHLAKQPISPYQMKTNATKQLSKIIMKMLQKDVDNRYQSAYGLLVDLKRCIEELSQKGEISLFDLGEYDVSEYFYIPQKLYGRESEILLLTQACNNINQDRTETVMIAGPAGTGKSALAQEIQPIITAKNGYFLMGKFERLNRNIAYSAIIQAFQSWIKQVLSGSEQEILTWKGKLLTVLGNQAQLLIDVLPDLELIVGKQPPVPTLDPEQTKNRFQWFFQRFIMVIAQIDHPLVLFLDDWQWSDAASLDLLEVLMTNPDTRNLLLFGAYRDNEVDTSHPALVTLEAIRKFGVNIRTITLQPLNVSAVSQLIVETLHCPLERALPFAALIYQKTEGVAFFIKAFLQMLYDQHFLTRIDKEWHWDLTEIQQLPITENVITFMTQEIQKLPPLTKNTLQFASCLHHRFSMQTLQLITQKSIEELHKELQPLLESGLLLSIGDHFQFSHDRIREAAYKQMSEEIRTFIHLSIGRLFQANLPISPTLEQLSELADHLNHGSSLIADQDEQLSLIKLNLETAHRAKIAAAYSTALHYLETGERYLVAMGNDDFIWQEHYALAYELYKSLAEMQYLTDHFEASKKCIDLVLNHAQTIFEKVDIYNLYISQETVLAHYQEAIDIGYKALSLLGIHLQEKDLQQLWQIELHQAKEISKKFSKVKDILEEVPIMTDLNIKALVKLLHTLMISSYFGNPFLHALITTMIVNLSLQYGNLEESYLGYSCYGFQLICQQNEIQLGYDFGLLGIQLSEKFHHLTSQCRTNCVYGGLIHHWRKPCSQAEIYIDKGWQAGLAGGDFQYLGYLADHKVTNLFYQGKPLNDIEPEIKKYLCLPYIRSNRLSFGVLIGLQLVINNVMGKTPHKTSFRNEIKDSEDYEANWKQEKNFTVLAHYFIFKSQALYLHGQFETALEFIVLAKDYLDFIPGHVAVAEHNYYYSLIIISLYPTASLETQQSYWQQLEVNQEQLKFWTDNCPENFLHKYLIVAAEMARITNNYWEAFGKYDKAIQLSQKEGFIQEQAIACELAAKFGLEQDKLNYAQGLLQNAYQLYEEWGAKRKAGILLHQYPDFGLKPTSKLSNFDISGETTISANSLRLLDLASILKTSQIISSEVDLRKLLVKIMNILTENAGAQKGAFLLKESDELLLQAEYTIDGRIFTLQQLPLSHWEGGALSIIEYVKRTQQPVLLSNASTDKQFHQDPYICAHHILSILCIPVIRHKELKGILYMENNLASCTFSEQHLQILTLLASQMAISLENSTYYESIRSVSERLNLALQSGNVGTWSWNIQENKLVWDQYMYELHGIKQEEFGQTYESAMALVHPDDVRLMEQAIKRTLSDNVPFVIEYRIIKPDKSVYVMAAQGKVFRDEKDRAERLLGVVWDITLRKRLEEERLQALTQAEEKEHRRAEDAEKYRKNLENFINQICHEIRNPMTGIFGNVELCQQTLSTMKCLLDILPTCDKLSMITKSWKKLDECTTQIEQCIKHQKTIIDDVLDLSKLESGKTILVTEPFNLKTVIQEVVQIFAAPIALKNLPLIISLPQAEYWILGDANRLKMVLSNILSNAVKFTEQGYIKITLQIMEVTTAYLVFTVTVEDTGIGMTKEEQSQLFQRFARVAASEYEGSGLGLYISKRYIECMGGDIIVQSQKGQGSKFTIQLKCETVQLEETKPIPKTFHSPSPVPSATKHILVVEDNVMNQRILRRQLEQAGHHCEVANNGQEALSKWRASSSSSSFDLIFMDIEMPVMGGFEATQAIRKQEQQLGVASRTPIIGLSAYTSSEFTKQANEIGMDDYITKPYEKEKLFQAIEKCTEMKREKTNKLNEVLPTTQHKKARIE